jgi:phenylacetate-CoA ligase
MGSRYYDDFETASRADIEELQEQKLLQQLTRVVDRQPLLRDIWQKASVAPTDIRSLADFRARAPFMDKNMIRAWRDQHGDPFGGILACDAADVNHIGSSSGTTGDPTLFAYRWHVPGGWIFHPRQLWELGLRPGDYAVDFTFNTRAVSFEIYVDMGVIPLLVDHDPGDLRRLLDLSRRYRPKVLHLLSSPMIIALEQLEREGVPVADAWSSYEAIVFGGEPLSPRLRGVCERWGMKIYQMTSLGDSGTAFECRERSGFHAFEDFALIEVIDPQTGLPVADGERGELVVTNLVDPTAPLIRYRTEDLVRMVTAPCACGRTHARFWVDGRAGDELVIAGHSILPLDIWSAIESIDECSAGMFQIIRPQRQMEVLKLRVGHDGSCDVAALKKRVAVTIEAKFGLTPEIELVPNAELLKLGPPHKIPRVSKK